MGTTENNQAAELTVPDETVKTGIEQVKEKTQNSTDKETTVVDELENDEAKANTYDDAYIEKLNKKHQASLAAAVEEAVKKATMGEEEKAAYEKQQKEAELERREKELELKELKSETRSILADKKLPDKFTDMVIGEDLETTTKNIEALKNVFDAAVQEQVETRLKGNTPSQGTGTGKTLTGKETLSTEVDKYL